MMLQHHEPDDYVVATGREVTVRDMVQYVFEKIGLGDYQQYVRLNPRYVRPYELAHLQGRADKAERVLGWKPKYTFEMLMDEMIVEIEQRFWPHG